jgi:hypothetical protein
MAARGERITESEKRRTNAVQKAKEFAFGERTSRMNVEKSMKEEMVQSV